MQAHNTSDRGDVVVVENEIESGYGNPNINLIKRSVVVQRNGPSPLSTNPDQNTPRIDSGTGNAN